MDSLRASIFLIILSVPTLLVAQYQGKPWDGKVQHIPGKVECEFYDMGGEGVAYHDKDTINNGSGKLNPKNGSLLNEFRMSEAVDISFTKPAPVDANPFNLVEPLMNQLYVGWTEPGEWVNYSIEVDRAGAYEVSLMYTASGDGTISLLLDGQEFSGEFNIASTRNDNETVDWRQWHHWNIFKSSVPLQMTKGKHLLTLRTTGHGNMNYDYLLFERK